MTLTGAISTDNTKISSNGAGALTALQALFTHGSLTRIGMAGPFTVTSTKTAFNHGLGGTPNIVIPIIDTGGLSGAHNCYVDTGSYTSTQVSLKSDTSMTVYILAIAF